MYARPWFIFALVALGIFGIAHAGTVNIARDVQGSGTPGAVGYESASPVLSNDIYFAPQFMPAYPTAATIWPRVVEVPCTETPAGLQCDGYQWTPKMGRAEYLFFTPKIVKATVVEKLVPVPYPVPGPERIILKEVLAKKKAQ